MINIPFITAGNFKDSDKKLKKNVNIPLLGKSYQPLDKYSKAVKSLFNSVRIIIEISSFSSYVVIMYIKLGSREGNNSYVITSWNVKKKRK